MKKLLVFLTLAFILSLIPVTSIKSVCIPEKPKIEITQYADQWNCHCLSCGKDIFHLTFHCTYCGSTSVTCTKIPPLRLPVFEP
jgi:hypothetical protein